MTKKSKKQMCVSSLKLRVMAEYASSGIWVIGQTGLFRHGHIDYSALRLPAELARRFEQWIELYWGRLDCAEYARVGFDVEEFNRAGRALAKELKDHIGPMGYVEFLPELESDGMGQAEVIE